MKALKPVLIGLAALGLFLFAISFATDKLDSLKWFAGFVGLGALSLLPASRVIRAAFGTAVLAILVFFVTQLLGLTNLGHKNIDLTEDDRYTLTEGTKSILSELQDPVIINYYVTRDLRSTPADLQRYIPRVDNLLEEFAALATDERITVNFIDPKPNTDEEDAAALDQIQEFPVSQEENMLFGAAISCWDKKTVISFFNPENETQLEFDLISAIAEVSARNKPTVGLVSPLNLTTGGQTGQGWIFSQLLSRAYNLADLGMGVSDRLEMIYQNNEWGDAPDHLDPEKIPVVLVIHPAAITPEAEFALDQYLLRGGTVVACLDAHSIAAQQTAGASPQIPGMPPQGGVATSSSLPKLFEHHKIKFSGNQVLADGKFGIQNNPTILNLGKEAMPVEDDLALASISQILLGYAGAFTEVNATGLAIERLIRSSRRSSLVAASDALNEQTARRLGFKLRSEDRQYDLLIRLSGNFTTAFPEGNPSSPPTPDAEDAEDAEDEVVKPTALATAEGKGNLYLFADSDFLYDGAAYRNIPVGRGAFVQQPLSDNGPLVFNLLDQATNSKYLIGSRARTPNWRPFTVFQEMKAEAEEKTGREIEKIEESRKDWNDQISKLISNRDENGQVRLSASDEAKLSELREKEVEARKQIRELQKDNQSEIDAIKSGIFWKSTLYVPLFVFLIGLCVFIYRYIQTQAR